MNMLPRSQMSHPPTDSHPSAVNYPVLALPGSHPGLSLRTAAQLTGSLSSTVFDTKFVTTAIHKFRTMKCSPWLAWNSLLLALHMNDLNHPWPHPPHLLDSSLPRHSLFSKRSNSTYSTHFSNTMTNRITSVQPHPTRYDLIQLI